MKKLFLIALLTTASLACADDAAKPKPYPFDTCVVSGQKLGEMGEPYVFVYQGQQVKLCCSNCKEEFDKTPDVFLKKIQK